MAATSRREQIEEMLAESPDDSLLRYMLAMEHISAGDDAGAVTVFGELLRRDPKYVPAYMQAAQAHNRLGQLDEARATFRSGIDMARQQGDHHAADEMSGFLAGLEE